MSPAKISFKEFRVLAGIVGEEHVTAREEDLIHYTHDTSARSLIQRRHRKPEHWPHAVAWPASTQEVVQALQWARRNNIPLIVFGGGSGLSGSAIPVQGGLVLDLKRMDQIESVNPKKYSAVAQAGINCLRLEHVLQEQGLSLGHFPDSIGFATLGGAIACRGAGRLSSLYGTIEQMVEAVEAVLPSGEVLSLGAKQVPGLKGLSPVDIFAGSEGTLGIITRCRLRLHRKPAQSRYRAVSFRNLGEGLRAIRKITQMGLTPAVLCFYDRLDSVFFQWAYETHVIASQGRRFFPPLPPLKARLIRSLGQGLENLKQKTLQGLLSYPRALDFLAQRIPAHHILIMGFEGDATLIEAQEQEALKICQEMIVRDEGRAMAEFWRQRALHEAFRIPQLFRQQHFTDTIELATTWDRMEDLYIRVRRALARYCCVTARFRHVHHIGSSIAFNLIGSETPEHSELSLFDRSWRDALDACLQVGGTITHHHGVGLQKAPFMRRELGPLMDYFRNLKDALDPDEIMNPGKMGL